MTFSFAANNSTILCCAKNKLGVDKLILKCSAILAIAVLLSGCEKSMLDTDRAKAFKYTVEITNAKVALVNVQERVDAVRQEQEQYINYEKNELPALMAEYKSEFYRINSSNIKLEQSISESNEKKKIAYNEAIEKENARVQAENELITSQYQAKLQIEEKVEADLIAKYTKEDESALEIAATANIKSFKKAHDNIFNSKSMSDIAKSQENNRALAMYFPVSSQYIALLDNTLPISIDIEANLKSEIQTVVLNCINDVQEITCKPIATLKDNGVLYLPKLHRESEYQSAKAENRVVKPTLIKPIYPAKPILEKIVLEALPIEPKNPFTNNTKAVKYLESVLKTKEATYNSIVKLADENGLDVDWDGYFSDVKGSIKLEDMKNEFIIEESILKIVEKNLH